MKRENFCGRTALCQCFLALVDANRRCHWYISALLSRNVLSQAQDSVDAALFDACRSIQCAELEVGTRLQTALGGYAEDCREALGVALRNSDCVDFDEECTAAEHKLGSLKLQSCTEAELLKALESEIRGWHEALSVDTRLAGFDCQSRIHSRTVVRQQMERELIELNKVASEARKAAVALVAAAAAQRNLYQV